MLSSLKGKLQNVQEELANSLKNLKLDRHVLRLTTGSFSRPSSTRRLKGRSQRLGSLQNDPNFEIGQKLLRYYNTIWTEIHTKTVQSAHAAEEADIIVTTVRVNYDHKASQMRQMSELLAMIPKLVHGVQQISDHILQVHCAFDETEEAILSLEDMIETQELREKELEHRFQLALYQKKRVAELDDLKEKLTNDHFAKVKEHDKKMASHHKDRQAGFQEAFEQDLQQYKEGSLVPRRQESSSTASTPLEEIELDEDPYFLEDFLSDETQEMDKNKASND